MSAQVIKETATELVYTDTYQMVISKHQVAVTDLPAGDGVPLDSNWQRAQINLLI